MKDWTDILDSIEGFEWDEGNINKNWERHGVSHVECEEIFFNSPVIVKGDALHSASEDRYFVLGKTDTDRLLFVVFTVRGARIRIISARDMNRKERTIYAQTQKDTEV
ncbi:MAG: BrnT family toxin [Nitrospiraceae bacterium]|nr:BrnT family toxin [Nitrospiraceae bacterium]